MKLVLLIVFLLSAAIATFPQAAPVDLGRLRQMLDQHEFESAAAVLGEIATDDPEFFAAKNLDYLLGRTFEKLGQAGGAIQHFESVRRRKATLAGRALWHLSKLARSTGNLFLERLYLTELTTFHDKSLVSAAARERLAESYLESGDAAETIRLLTRNSEPGASLSESSGKSDLSRSRKRRILLANAYLIAARTPEAVGIFDQLISSTPSAEQPDDFALAAVRALDAVAAADPSGAQLTDSEHFRRAGVYHFNREFAAARDHYSAILNGFASAQLTPRTIFQIGRTYAQEGNFVDAVKWFERETGDPDVARDSLLQAASAYARLGKHREAVFRYQSFAQKYPDDANVDRAYLNMIDALRDEGEETAAIQLAQKTQEIFRGQAAEGLALFSEARIYMSKSDWPAALDALNRLGGRPDLGGPAVAGGTTVVEIAFLRAFAFEQAGRFAEAIDVYLSIPDGKDEYYGGLATARLRDLAVDPASQPSAVAKLAEASATIRSSDPELRRRAAENGLRLSASAETQKFFKAELAAVYAKIPSFSKPFRATISDAAKREVLTEARGVSRSDSRSSIAAELIYLGLYDEAAPEYEAAEMNTAVEPGAGRKPAATLRPDTSYTLAFLYARGDRGDRASELFGNVWNVPVGYPPEMIDSEYARFIFPSPYKQVVLSNARPRGIDPRLLLSIMKQESGFRPNVKSNAAARGLMQFISSTAVKTARGVDIVDFRDSDLYDPQISILLGSRYVEQLFTLFPAMPEAVAAAYNGGEDNMKRWLGRSRTREADRYVSEIAFAQSKVYVQRVMSGYRMYRMLYDENLEPMLR